MSNNLILIRKYSILKINDQRLLHHYTSGVLERLVRWILVHVVIAVLVGVELQNKRVAHSDLHKDVSAIGNASQREDGVPASSRSRYPFHPI
jgi:hypothetical protein